MPLRVQRVDVWYGKGESPEAIARERRYAALHALAAQVPAVQGIALAQHADDQVETLLLAFLRGAGLPGLAAMPACWQRGGIAYARPFLAVPGAALRDWLHRQGLKAGADWVEDPSNASPRYTRNRIRAHVLPVLQVALLGFRATFARSAAHAAQAQQVLDKMTAQDLTACDTAKIGRASCRERV